MADKTIHQLLRVAAECVCASIAVAFITFVCFRFQLDVTTPTCLYLLVIVLLSLRGSFLSSGVVSVLAVGCLDYYFVPPIFSFSVASATDVVAFITFLAASATITQLVRRLRKLLQEKLQHSERRYAVTLSSIGDAVIATDGQAHVTFMNRVAEALTGWQSSDAVGRPLTEVFRIVNEETREVVEDPAAKVLRLDTIVGLANHTALLARDGRELPIDDSGSPIIDDNGNIAGVVLVFRDMTQRRQAEEAELLRRSKELMELAVRGSNMAIWEVDMPDGLVKNGRVTLINAWESLGYDPVEAPTDFTGVFTLSVHPQDRARVGRAVQACLDGETRELDVEYRIPHKDGSEHWHLTRGTVVRDQKGRPIRFIGSRVDITNLKRADDALRQSEQRFRTFVDHATDAFFLHDERFVILDVNRQACESLGYTRDELLGKTPRDVDPDVTPAALDEIERKLSAGEMMAFESRHRRKDGTIFPVEVRGQTFREGGRRFSVALVRDMTERKKIEVALRQSEERFRGTFENASIGIANVDFEGHWLRVNQRLCDIVGYTREEMLQKTFQEITYADDLAISLVKFTPFTQGELPDFSLQKRYVRKDGSIVWVELFESLQRDAAGKPVYAIVMIQDISERKRLEVELRDSEYRWRSLTEALPQLVWTARPDGYADYLSAQCSEYFGAPESKLVGWKWLESLHPDDQERTRQAWQAAIEKEGDYEIDHRFRRFDGVYRWFTTRGVRIRDGQGNVLKWFGTCTDITDGKNAEEALRESEHRWRTLSEALPQLVWTAMPDGACDHFSTQWTLYTGLPAGELLGWQWLKSLHPDDREPTRQFWTDSVAGRHDYDVEYRVRRFDGEYRWFKTRGVPIRDADGRIFKWFGTCTDITDGKLAAEELRLAKEAAESANRAKDEFLANVSHEIRTPMNAILGLTTLVLGTRLDDGQRQSLATVKSAGSSLLGIINDLLDFSKIEAGKLELDRGEFSLRAALGDTLRALAIRAHQKGLELASNVLPDVPDALIGDAGRLRQVLLNIVGNAIKFTEKGEVVVQVSCVSGAPSTQDDVHLLFTVRDTGVGIPREKHAAIFRAFEQEDSSTTRKYGGTGLGLTIAAQLAALMGGNITVDSEPGRGSTFSVTARFGRSTKRGTLTGANGSADLLENLRVLIVDDNLTNRQILEEWLQNWRMRPMAVGDGAAAVSALRHAAEMGAPYSLALLDGRMPDIDGLTLAGQVRQRVDLSSTRIILLTSDDTSINAARSREVGISAHLVKPVQQSELLETIRHVMGQTSADTLATAAAGSVGSEPILPAPAVPLHILVAEDNEFNVTLLKQLFDRKGHRVRIAGDGREALTLATAGTFDALLLDIHLPEMDGFTVAQAIREQERSSGKHLPIIAFTARSGKQDRQRCLAAGMDDFLSKPVQADALWEVIDRVVAAHRPADKQDPGLLDPRTILAACGGDPTILEKMCRTFQERIPHHLIAVQDALRERDAMRLREAAHKLFGMASVFSTVAGDTVSDLEYLAVQGRLEEAVPLVKQLETMVQQLLELASGLSIDNLRARQ